MNEINLIHGHNSRYNNRENRVKNAGGMRGVCVIRITIVNNSHYFLENTESNYGKGFSIVFQKSLFT